MRRFLFVAVVLAYGLSLFAQPTEMGPQIKLAEEVAALARELRLAMYYAALAVYAPTPADQRLYAQQVVNLIEGEEGEHFVAESPMQSRVPGMLQRLELIRVVLPPAIPPTKKRAVLLILNNVRTFLEFALGETLASLRRSDVATGSEHLRKAFAFLYTAWGVEVDTPYLGGVWLLLRHLEYSQRPGAPGRPRP